VVVDDFDILGSSFRPAEANAPLVVDSDAELTEAISLQGLQSIAAQGTFTQPDQLRFPIPKADDHWRALVL
jgi:hypothetical protein